MPELVAREYNFDFVVRAKDWDEAIAIFRDELGITKKQNSSDRKIDGLFLVSCSLRSSDLTKEFYEKIANSEKIAIHSDSKSSSLYPKILEETRAIEERLRWLLLHVSDAIEDYARLLGYEKNEIVEKDKLDPITSRLSFEEILNLLEIDQSWAREGVNNERMRKLIRDSSDFESFKATYLHKTRPRAVWESISDLVLQKPVKWDAILPKLKSIKALRNKCAHFHTVTDDDLSQARNLRAQIMTSLTKKGVLTSADIRAFAKLSERLAETIRSIQASYYEDIAKLTDASFSAQQTLAKLSGSGLLPSVTEVAKSVADTVNRMYSPVFESNYYKIATSVSKPAVINSESTKEAQIDTDDGSPQKKRNKK